jgi:microsomal dipeptidase-like Zn-dependent dipeptidase
MEGSTNLYPNQGMIVDAAHASHEAISDILETLPSLPFLVSHAGVYSVCPSDVSTMA